MDNRLNQKQPAEKSRWRKLDNTAKLFAAVAGEDLSNVFRISVVLKEEIQGRPLKQALTEVLEEFSSFKVKLRRGFFWYYFEANGREVLAEEESTYPCKYIDPHSSHLYLFRVSYYKKRINLEVFHALTDGMGAANFLRRMTERYLELVQENGCIPEASGMESDKSEHGREYESKNDSEQQREIEKAAEFLKNQELTQERNEAGRKEDGYLRYYRKRPYHKYGTEQAMQIDGELLPLDSQSVIHGTLSISGLKNACRQKGVSITKYLTALLIWSLIQVYEKGNELRNPAAVNLPINLRSFFDSETMANFFAVTNINWPAGRRPGSFDEVLQETCRQMDEKIVKDKLEETISYNVSNEKKWYVRITPLFIKQIIINLIFMKSNGAYTATLSNIGPIGVKDELKNFVEEFQVMIGASRRQRMKCAVVAFDDKICITFSSVLNDTRLSDYFFRFLMEQGIFVELESNGAADQVHDKGTYPAINYDKKYIKKMVNIFYLVLFTAALIVGTVNLATYELTRSWWSVIAIGGIAYVAMTLRYSIMRRATLAGILVVQSIGAQILLFLIDYMTGYHGWSFNYAIPSVILFDIIAAVFLMLVNRLNWQSYFMYQVAITVLSFILLILWAVGLIDKPLMAIITVLLAVSVMFVTVILGDRSVKNELKRRFHF